MGSTEPLSPLRFVRHKTSSRQSPKVTGVSMHSITKSDDMKILSVQKSRATGRDYEMPYITPKVSSPTDERNTHSRSSTSPYQQVKVEISDSSPKPLLEPLRTQAKKVPNQDVSQIRHPLVSSFPPNGYHSDPRPTALRILIKSTPMTGWNSQ